MNIPKIERYYKSFLFSINLITLLYFILTIMIVYFITTVFNAIQNCISNNHSSYVIPSAQMCVPNFSNKMDGYFFGPCNTTVDNTLNCNTVLNKCRFAKYRHNYCTTRDAHLCSLQKQGEYVNFYQVECG